MRGSKPDVSVVVPCYNEQDNIETCVYQIDEAFKSANISHEILIVNDGSTDQTLKRAHHLYEAYLSVRVIDLVRNCGKTVALREGVRRARGELVAFFDADLQYMPKDLVAMVSQLNNGTDFVNGSRDYNGYGTSRTALSRLYNKVMRLLFQIELRDSNCGIKVLKKEAVGVDGIFDYGLPLIVPLLKIRGFESAEYAVTLHQRKNGQSKYFKPGSFMGGSQNIRDITYHAIMLLNLVAHAPLESMRKRMTSEYSRC